MNRLIDKIQSLLESGGTKRDITFLVLGGLSLLLSLMDSRVNFFGSPIDFAWIAIILCGLPIVLEAIIGLVTRFDIKADVLVSIALIASVIIHEEFAAGEIAVIMQLGSLLEDLTVAKARKGIENLVSLTPGYSRVVRNGEQSFIKTEEVQVDDCLRILPGEIIPVDGVILQGDTSVNQAVLTGESLPIDKGAGDEVFSGTLNQFGAFFMRATKVGEDSSIQRMIRLVQSADADKAKIVGLADRWAPWIVVIALSAAALTWIISGEIIRAVTILVVFCPCALVLATPTAIMAAIGNATKHGMLAGYVVLSDTVRDESAEMIEKVKALGVTPVLLTGDNENAATYIASKLGITEVQYECLPEDKLSFIDEYQKGGSDVCMIGDGINDAPALKKANVGIAMAGIGSDIAVDAADIALVDDEIRELPHLIALSKRMMRTIKINLAFSLALNFLAIALAITGLLGPVIGALVHNAGSVLVIINSALLLKWRSKGKAKQSPFVEVNTCI